MKRWVLSGFLSFLFLFALVSSCFADERVTELVSGVLYNVTLKGTSKTLTGGKFPFTATGTMTWDSVTGQMSFNVTTSVAVNFTGTGILANGPKGCFGLTTLDSGSAEGEAVFSGKFSKDNTKFSGKFYAGSPNRIGPAPGGFVFTSGTVKATQQ